MIEIAAAIIGGVVSLVLWLLRAKDGAQERQITDHAEKIELLFSKHDADVKELQDLRVQIAGNHYQKHELDAKFDRLEGFFREGFKGLSDKLDKLSEAVIGRQK